MTNVPFDKWARPQVRDLLCFAEGSDRRGSRVADLYALEEEDTASRVTVWAADILSLMQSAFEEGWEQGGADLLNYQQEARRRLDALPGEVDGLRGLLADISLRLLALERRTPRRPRPRRLDADLDVERAFAAAMTEPEEPEAAEHDPGPEVDDEGGMSEHRLHAPEPWE